MALIKRQDGGYPTLRTWLDNMMEPGRFFEDEFLKTGSIPAVNIKETDKTYEIEVAAPGLNKKDFHITVENDRLVIKGERTEEKKEEDENYSRKEFNYSSFYRSFNLPEDAKPEEIKAKYEDGILKLSMMKTKESKPKKKEITVS